MPKKRKTKKRKFREVKLKLTARQYESISNYAKSRNKSLNKFIRGKIAPYLSGYEKQKPVVEKVPENQMTIFHLIDNQAEAGSA
ncbi:MAG: hypothetical protein IPM52_04265 [Bacteroidetes bacterium]|nr:hypothetical protein [Bacteroidota bacterium]